LADLHNQQNEAADRIDELENGEVNLSELREKIRLNYRNVIIPLSKRLDQRRRLLTIISEISDIPLKEGLLRDEFVANFEKGMKANVRATEQADEKNANVASAEVPVTEADMTHESVHITKGNEQGTNLVGIAEAKPNGKLIHQISENPVQFENNEIAINHVPQEHDIPVNMPARPIERMQAEPEPAAVDNGAAVVGPQMPMQQGSGPCIQALPQEITIESLYEDAIRRKLPDDNLPWFKLNMALAERQKQKFTENKAA
jgi:hypothetical protein